MSDFIYKTIEIYPETKTEQAYGIDLDERLNDIHGEIVSVQSNNHGRDYTVIIKCKNK
jgi:hypothetical protein